MLLLRAWDILAALLFTKVTPQTLTKGIAIDLPCGLAFGTSPSKSTHAPSAWLPFHNSLEQPLSCRLALRLRNRDTCPFQWRRELRCPEIYSKYRSYLVSAGKYIGMATGNCIGNFLGIHS